MIEAPDAAFLVPAEHQRSLAVRAEFVEHTDLAVGIAENDEVFPKQPDLDGVAIGLGHLLDQAGRQPVTAHDSAHGRIAFDAAEQVIFLVRQHVTSPRIGLTS